ncbi:hypothetical protein Rumeso_03795 [Rubellimicrobium mesophilum DSM 19309]|uniref:Uncharacterized protein n=1 Tax=Rubellimicrobium mesophilum DSM 19309 TaxID=442562 RepID=A0A017HL44_9RHOB|nr:hypothetical protein [Rubellimicrobium mesophilum]EYD74499.1 hypothetical protein Rumeso_03795 [Rubellimicrobium mesophilum DSM 19309]
MLKAVEAPPTRGVSEEAGILETWNEPFVQWRHSFAKERDEAKRKPWSTYKVGLDVLCSRIERRLADQGGLEDQDPVVKELLRRPSEKESPDFLRLYEAEQRLALLMSDDEIRDEAEGRFARARQLRLPSYADLRTAFDRDDADAATRRTIYITLVRELQRADQRRSLDQFHRRKAARRLNLYGCVLIVPSVLLLAYFYYRDALENLGPYHMIAVMWCGLAGAFLSRMILFQRVLATIGAEEIATEFSHFAIILRLIIGTLGALVMYFLIVGQVVDGDFFPDWTADSHVWQRFGSSFAAAGQTSSEDFNLVSTDFAQLLIWSTIAGFSERIIPDRFARMEVAVLQPQRSESL